MRDIHRIACLVVTICGAGLLAGCGDSRTGDATAGTPPRGVPQIEVKGTVASAAPAKEATDAPGFFSPTSFWSAALEATAPLDPASVSIVNSLASVVARERQAGSGPWINTRSYSVPLYTVPASQPTATVDLVEHAPDAALSAAWRAVPLPANAHPSAGTDGVLALWQPSTDRLWEFWKLARGGGGWQARWGGAMRNVSTSSGVYGPSSWPGAKTYWGVAASSLSLVGGLVTLADLKRGEIDHALSLALPDVRAREYASPARRTDGQSTDPLSLPEGAHLRLNPKLDLAALHLPQLTLMLARAAQRYGIIVIDRAPNVTFYAQDPTPTGTNPYTGAGGYFEGKYPDELLASFPWRQLQLLRMELHGGP